MLETLIVSAGDFQIDGSVDLERGQDLVDALPRSIGVIVFTGVVFGMSQALDSLAFALSQEYFTKLQTVFLAAGSESASKILGPSGVDCSLMDAMGILRAGLLKGST